MVQFTVGFLKADPNARYQGYTFYFKEGIFPPVVMIGQTDGLPGDLPDARPAGSDE
jgi:hypothetical protein